MRKNDEEKIFMNISSLWVEIPIFHGLFHSQLFYSKTKEQWRIGDQEHLESLKRRLSRMKRFICTIQKIQLDRFLNLYVFFVFPYDLSLVFY